MLAQVTFRGLAPSSDVVDRVQRKTQKLGEVAPLLRSCHVVIEASPWGNPHPLSYRVALHLSGGPEAEARLPRHATDSNLQAALSSVFRSARRQLHQRTKPRRRAPALRGELRLIVQPAGAPSG